MSYKFALVSHQEPTPLGPLSVLLDSVLVELLGFWSDQDYSNFCRLFNLITLLRIPIDKDLIKKHELVDLILFLIHTETIIPLIQVVSFIQWIHPDQEELDLIYSTFEQQSVFSVTIDFYLAFCQLHVIFPVTTFSLSFLHNVLHVEWSNIAEKGTLVQYLSCFLHNEKAKEEELCEALCLISSLIENADNTLRKEIVRCLEPNGSIVKYGIETLLYVELWETTMESADESREDIFKLFMKSLQYSDQILESMQFFDIYYSFLGFGTTTDSEQIAALQLIRSILRLGNEEITRTISAVIGGHSPQISGTNAEWSIKVSFLYQDINRLTRISIPKDARRILRIVADLSEEGDEEEQINENFIYCYPD